MSTIKTDLTVKQIISDVLCLDIDEIDLGSDFHSLRCDDVDLFQISNDIFDHFGVLISPSVFGEGASVNDIVNFISSGEKKYGY